MKIKNIVALKNRLDKVTESVEIADEGMESKTIRYDVYEETVQIETDNTTFNLSVAEAKRLRSALNSLL